MGGYYTNYAQYDGTIRGLWWGSESYNEVARYMLGYNSDVLYISNYGLRYRGLYIRCVQAP